MPKLIAAMVGRNEVNRYLKQVLDRLSEQVDLICFVDDCSEDDTLDVASSYEKVEWGVMNKPTFISDEHELRSALWSFVGRYAEEGDWILSIDCDEELYGLEYARHLLYQERWDVIGITFYHMWNETQYRVDGAWAPTLSSRLYRYKKGGKFRNRKLACGAEPTYVMDMVATRRFYKESPLRMKHLGYQSYDDQIAKYARYMELDGGEFHSIKHLKSIISPNPRLEDWHDE
jgi:hypothetical protein